ncbi:hypothetical protein ACWDRL_21655 [Streptomyces albidoflavus]|nr:hypothetical protein MTP02_52420 [Streptomyces albus]
MEDDGHTAVTAVVPLTATATAGSPHSRAEKVRTRCGGKRPASRAAQAAPAVPPTAPAAGSSPNPASGSPSTLPL